LERYNGVSALEFQGAPSPGKSTGDAIAAMQAAVAKLPKGVGYEWTAAVLRRSSLRFAGAGPVRHLAQRRVSVSRGALRELVDTLRGVVVVPLGIIGTISATLLRGLGNDVFFQVGLLTTVGLSAKNAILIVEFAKEKP